MQRNTKKKIAPVVVAALVVLYIGPLVAMVAYAAGLLGAEGGWGILPFLLLYAFAGGAVIVGVLYTQDTARTQARILRLCAAALLPYPSQHA